MNSAAFCIDARANDLGTSLSHTPIPATECLPEGVRVVISAGTTREQAVRVLRDVAGFLATVDAEGIEGFPCSEGAS